MVYNRCVGTRYCSNNCPYKVRRFNYFNFRDHFKNGFQEAPVFALLMNPEVTVRSRGVMEKCTFCIQRISEARSDATKENRALKGSDVRTACEEACTTNAIHFGDINDKEDELNIYRNHELGYHVLEELNIRPNVTYIAKLKNTNSENA
jgi:molybdopterin-containing oxidoreductase family iron-sulfur binding subunit